MAAHRICLHLVFLASCTLSIDSTLHLPLLYSH